MLQPPDRQVLTELARIKESGILGRWLKLSEAKLVRDLVKSNDPITKKLQGELTIIMELTDLIEDSPRLINNLRG